MARNLDRRLWEAWQRRIGQQQRSGLSIVAFCRKEGISPGSFHAWKRKLGGCGSATQSSQGRTAAETPQWATGERAAVKPASPNLKLEASTAAGFVQVPLATASGREWIELVLGDGTLVRVPAHQTAALTAILRVLRSADPTRCPVAEEACHA